MYISLIVDIATYLITWLIMSYTESYLLCVTFAYFRFTFEDGYKELQKARDAFINRQPYKNFVWKGTNDFNADKLKVLEALKEPERLMTNISKAAIYSYTLYFSIIVSLILIIDERLN
jgi:hypothetical protein